MRIMNKLTKEDLDDMKSLNHYYPKPKNQN